MAKPTAILSIIAAALTGGKAWGQSESGPYLRIDAGVNWAQEMEATIAGFNLAYEMDPGLRMDVAPGFQFNNWFALEFNTGVLWNGIDSLEGAGMRFSVEGDLVQVPFMPNAVIQTTWNKVTPFIGAGAGGIYQYVAIDSIGGTAVDSSGDDVYAAFQGFGGVQYEISDNFAVGIRYTYLRALTEEEVVVPGFGFGETEDLENHSVTFTVRFGF